MSLVEVLVGIAVGGILMTGMIRGMNLFTIRRLQAEASTRVQKDFSNIRRWFDAKVPKITSNGPTNGYVDGIRVYTSPDGGSTWNHCPSNQDCRGQTNFQFHVPQANGSGRLYEAMAQCQSNAAAGWPAGTVSRVPIGNMANCRTPCPAGTHPVVNIYEWQGDWWPDIPVTSQVGDWHATLTYPQNAKHGGTGVSNVRKAVNGELVSVGMCVDKLGASDNNSVTITLIGEYFVGGDEGGANRGTELVQWTKTYYMERNDRGGVVEEK